MNRVFHDSNAKLKINLELEKNINDLVTIVNIGTICVMYRRGVHGNQVCK